MPANILEPELAATAEPWLLPEIQASHVVSASTQEQSGGFRRRKTSQQSAAKFPRALTASRLEALETAARESGEKSGREQGYQQGYAEAQQAGRSLVEEYQHKLDALMQSIAAEVAQQQQELQQLLVKLVVEISAQVCRRELQFESNIEQIVSRAVQALPIDENSFVIKLNPADLSLLQNSPGTDASRWQLQADEELVEGDCRISSEFSQIDFRQQDRLQQIVEDVFARD